MKFYQAVFQNSRSIQVLKYLFMNILSAKDYIIFVIYFISVAGYGLWIYRRKKKTKTGQRISCFGWMLGFGLES